MRNKKSLIKNNTIFPHVHSTFLFKIKTHFMIRHLKLVILFVVCVLSFHQTWGQSQSLVGKVYVVYSDQISVFGLNASGILDSTLKFTAKGGTKFSVVGFDDKNNILVTFWRYGKWDPAAGKYRYTRSDTIKKSYFLHYNDSLEFIGNWANYKRFAINPRILNSSCKEYFGPKKEFTWGVMTLPIKARFGNNGKKLFDFEERLNLGFVFGLKKQLKGYSQHSLNYLAGFGISSARTDSLSMKDLSAYDGRTSLALSLHAGFLYQFEMFQVGLFIGADFVPGTVGRGWMHQGKPWVGLAIGVSLFSKNSVDGAEEGANKGDKPK
jgi:hypothetical protein